MKKSIEKQNMLAWQYNAVGVSDAITMGGEGNNSPLAQSFILLAQSQVFLEVSLDIHLLTCYQECVFHFSLETSSLIASKL